MAPSRTPPTAVRHVGDPERRGRLAVRHALAPGFSAASPEAAVQAMTVLHATEPATVYLSLWVRVQGFKIEDADRAFFVDRSLVKQLAMRRTLFVFGRDLLPAAWGSASARVAVTEYARIAKDVAASGLSTDGSAWLDRGRSEVLAHLAGLPEGLTAAEIRQAVPSVEVDAATYPLAVGMAPRVLTQLGAAAAIVRGANTGHWRVSRPRWTLMRHWLGDVPTVMDPDAGYRELVRRWLTTFGPGTEDDIVWWLGSTKAAVRTALASLDVVPVSLDGGATGWLLADDLAEVDDPEPWVALLPVLDPTVMGWKLRDFYLGAHRDALFDRNGNAGTTVWVNGRIVGCWTQDDTGRVVVHLLEKVSVRARRALDAEAERLTVWLQGRRIGTVYPSPAMKAARLP